MSTQLQDKLIELTTRYSDRVCKVFAYGYRKSGKEEWSYYIKKEAVKRAEKKICTEGDGLMLTPTSADVIGCDHIDVVSRSFSGRPLYATLYVTTLYVKR